MVATSISVDARGLRRRRSLGYDKLDPYLFFCADNPGVRCVDVAAGRCKPKFSSKDSAKKEGA